MQFKLPIRDASVSSVWDFSFTYVKILFLVHETGITFGKDIQFMEGYGNLIHTGVLLGHGERFG